MLQIRLTLDGRDVLSDALVPVGPHLWETAVMLPLTVQEVRWELTLNMKAVLALARTEDVGVDGMVIRH